MIKRSETTREKGHSRQLERLRSDIREGLASGPAEPLDMAAIKAEARVGQVRRKT